jgi:hypothetical protein
MSDSLINYRPHDEEAEKASNSYLMSLIALIVGVPLPIINLLATIIFYISMRSSSYYVRWHSTQALMSQAFVFVFNSVTFYWTLSILFGDNQLNNEYIAYLITVILFNLFEFIANIYLAIETRKGKHIHMWFVGPLTDLICKK